MAEPNFSWIYIIIFLAIPLARIIPRFLAKRGIGKNFFPQPPQQQNPQQQNPQQQNPQQQNPQQQNQSESHFDEYQQKPSMETRQPKSKNELVLGALNRGSKSFESIQKNTGLDSKDLDAILEDLEKNGLLKVVQKQGMFGPKTELLPTDKGFKEYYS
jgi:predicted transcriptional regulator